MTNQQLDKIKQVQLEIMDEIHRVCIQNSVTYYMICGTLLGAVRHRGFIPWDVDIDIAMPREDYDRFKEVCMSELGEKFHYCDHTNKKYYQQPHALVCKKNTNVYTKYDSINPIVKNYGIYIDVFPLDNAPDDAKKRKKQAKALSRIKKLKYLRIPYSYSSNSLKRKIHYMLSALLSVIPASKISDMQQKKMYKYKNQKTECFCSMASGYSYDKQCISKKIYGKGTLYDFEGRKYYGPDKYHEYLTRLYKDYMCLPPEDKRRANTELFTSVEFD